MTCWPVVIPLRIQAALPLRAPSSTAVRRARPPSATRTANWGGALTRPVVSCAAPATPASAPEAADALDAPRLTPGRERSTLDAAASVHHRTRANTRSCQADSVVADPLPGLRIQTRPQTQPVWGTTVTFPTGGQVGVDVGPHRAGHPGDPDQGGPGRPGDSLALRANGAMLFGHGPICRDLNAVLDTEAVSVVLADRDPRTDTIDSDGSIVNPCRRINDTGAIGLSIWGQGRHDREHRHDCTAPDQPSHPADQPR